MDQTTLLTFIAATFVLAGFVKGVIGLGLPTIAVGVLGVVMAPAQPRRCWSSPTSSPIAGRSPGRS